MSTLFHIASLFVQAHPVNRHTIEQNIAALPGAEVAHADDQGRIIVTLETSSEDEIVQALTDIQLLTGVVSASLVYHQTEDGLSAPAQAASGGVA